MTTRRRGRWVAKLISDKDGAVGAGYGVTLRQQSPYAIELGVEPPIEVASKRSLQHDRRLISFRWLAAVVMTGIAGSALIGVTIYAAQNGLATLAQAPELSTVKRQVNDSVAEPEKGDRLIKSADIISEKQSFRVPTAVKIGDRQIVRMLGYTHVGTTLALAPIGNPDDVPEFNPLKLLASDVNPPDIQADPGPGPTLDDAAVTFTVKDLAGADPTLFGPSLSKDEVQAQVGEFARNTLTLGRLPLPPQLLLMQTTRAGQIPSSELDFADPGFHPVPFSSIELKIVAENVTVMPRSDAARDARTSEERLVVFRHGDQLEDLLKANGATREAARAIVTAFNAQHGAAPVADGRRLKFLYTRPDDSKPAQIARISVYADENLETTIALADNGGYVQVAARDAPAKPLHAPANDDDAAGGFRLYDSLYETALKQEIPKPVIDNLVRVFANDVDFQRSVAGGDSFDAFYADNDEPDSRQTLLYASITLRNEVYKYYRFQAPDDGSIDFYDENGRSVRKFLMRSPVPNAQLTSGFGLRFHPILGYSRPHTGVDWAAPLGTPILAAGNGTVLRAHPESGYGNHVEIQHANGYITTYSHMAGFGRGIADGARVRQGQVVGYLGQTGLATGPHLHYEVIVNGHFVDPMRVKLARTREMDGKLLADFKRERDRIDGLMASAPNAVADKRASN